MALWVTCRRGCSSLSAVLASWRSGSIKVSSPGGGLSKRASGPIGASGSITSRAGISAGIVRTKL
jgi:hypothetical protein